MPIAMPALKQCPSPNYSPTAIAHDLMIFHLMEGGYLGSVAYLCLRSTEASAHLCGSADGSEVTQLVPLSLKAWAQCAFNSRGISLEMPGFTAKGVSDVTLDAMAKIGAWVMLTYGIPFEHAAGGQGRGYCIHHDLGAAGGGHVDICGINDATFQKLGVLLANWRDAFSAGPLPAWGLHGLPAPHQVSLAPDVAPEPSHGGAARNEAGDVVAHVTASTYPHGSVCDLQWRLNRAGAFPTLTIDGRAGPHTREAIAAFQGRHGLYVDGLIGPRTWAALDAATA